MKRFKYKIIKREIHLFYRIFKFHPTIRSDDLEIPTKSKKKIKQN